MENNLIINRSGKTKDWYKKEADRCRNLSYDGSSVFNMINGNADSTISKIHKNYNLFKNKINIGDYKSTIKPFGDAVDIEILEEIENEDIVSGKIKAILGMEMKRPFPFKVMAINAEATTRKEEEYYKRISGYVVSRIMQPIREKAEMEQQQKLQGKEPSPEEAQQIKSAIDEQIKAQTPDRTKKYMERDHQDLSEIGGNHILSYLKHKQKLPAKFNNCFLYGLLAGYQVGYVGDTNGHPSFDVIKPENFWFNHVESGIIEESDRVICKYRWNPSEILQRFGDELTKKQIESIFESKQGYLSDDTEFNFDNVSSEYQDFQNGLTVEHCLWKGVRKLQLVHTQDETGIIDITVEDEYYVFNEESGDIKVDIKYVPEIYETWVINLTESIYLRQRPYPGQLFDYEDIYYSPMPYKGVLYDSLGGTPVALMDRLSGPQVFYNIIKTKLKRLINSDKGKKLLLNIGMIPTSKGIGTEQFMNYFENSPFALINPTEEGNTYSDINTAAKVIDMSLMADIQKYMMLLQSIKREAGLSVGITEQVEGQISANEAVSNTQQSLSQSSQILEPYFNLHTEFKKQVLQGLLEQARVSYRENTEMKLSYVTDDATIQMFKVDGEFMSFQKLGVFVTDNNKLDSIRNTMDQLTLAAMQNQTVEFSDVLAVLRAESLAEAEEILKVSESGRNEKEEAKQQQAQQNEMQKMDKLKELQADKHEKDKELIILKEEEKRKTEIVKGSMLVASFNEDTDRDRDGVNDYIEMAAKIAKVEIEEGKLAIEKEKVDIEKKKVNNDIKNSKIINK